MRSSLPPSMGGGTAASIAICSGAGDSRLIAESTECATCEEKRRVSTCVRPEASKTAPPQKHDWPSSRDSRLGDSSWLGPCSHRHRSQQAFPTSVSAEAYSAAPRTEQVYGQSSTAAMATIIGSERIDQQAFRNAILSSTLHCSSPSYNPNVIRDVFHSLNQWSPANINPVCRDGYITGFISTGDATDHHDLLLLDAQ